ncbi:MAG: DUF1801 domain-containing protein [Pseudomonadota bacterium]|nr:DUF1801 domain-containing protein [Pseudomonadota bacterium]
MDDAEKIELHYATLTQWREEQLALRELLRSLPLSEELKWHQPVYTHAGGNICMPAGFKDRCVLSFFKGALLEDPADILRPPGPNSRGARVVEFHSLNEVEALSDTLRAYVQAAIAVEASGRKVEFAKDDLPQPQELTDALDRDADLAQAFAALTPGRRRAWTLHIGQARQSATRSARIEKARPMILQGKGLNGR